MAFLEELKRRKVVRVVIAYAVAAFVVVQVADIALPALRAPDWVMSVIVVLAALGFPVVAVLAWAFDITPTGLERSDARAAPNATRRALVGLVALTVIVLAGAAAFTWTRFASRSDLDQNLLAVVPFRVTGDSDVSYLREGMLDLLAATLNGDADLRAADPRSVLTAWRSAVDEENDDLSPEVATQIARRIGAGRLLLGSVIATGDELRISAQLHHVDSNDDPVSFNVSGRANEVHALIDRLAGQLLSVEAGVSENRLASLTTTSLPALRHYLTAQSLYRRSRFDDAVQAYDAAVGADSTFGLAALGLSMSVGWGTGTPRDMTRVNQLIANSLERFSAADRSLARAVIGSTYPKRRNAVQALADWEAAIDAAPERPEPMFMFADVMVHNGGLIREDFRVVANEGFRRTLELDSTFTPAVTHLLDSALLERDTAGFQRYARLLETDAREVANYQYLGRQIFLHGPAALQGMDTLATDDLVGLIFDYHLIGQVDRPHALRAADLIRSKAFTTAEKRNALEITHYTLLNQGLIADATRAGEEMRALSPDDGNPLVRIVGAALYWDGDQPAARAAADRLTALIPRLTGLQQVRATCMLAQWRAANGGDHAALLAALDAAANDSATAGITASVCGSVVRATHALQSARGLTEAARDLDAHTINGPVAVGSALMNEANLALARVYEAAGDRAAALRAARRRYIGPGMLWYETTRVRENARLAELNGERDEAIQWYTEFLRLREPGSPGTGEAQRALARLTAERTRT